MCYFFTTFKQVPPGAVMVDGSPVFLTCPDQEVLEVAKAVLREKFPQVRLSLPLMHTCHPSALRWRKSVAAKQVLGCATLPGFKFQYVFLCLCYFFCQVLNFSMFSFVCSTFPLQVPGSVRSQREAWLPWQEYQFCINYGIFPKEKLNNSELL